MLRGDRFRTAAPGGSVTAQTEVCSTRRLAMRQRSTGQIQAAPRLMSWSRNVMPTDRRRRARSRRPTLLFTNMARSSGGRVKRLERLGLNDRSGEETSHGEIHLVRYGLWVQRVCWPKRRRPASQLPLRNDLLPAAGHLGRASEGASAGKEKASPSRPRPLVRSCPRTRCPWLLSAYLGGQGSVIARDCVGTASRISVRLRA